MLRDMLGAIFGMSPVAQVVGEAAAVTLSDITNDVATDTARRLEADLRDRIHVVRSLRSALRRRGEGRARYGAALSAVSARRAHLAKLRRAAHNRGPKAEMRTYDAEVALGAAQIEADQAGTDYEQVKRRVHAEVDRFRSDGAASVR